MRMLIGLAAFLFSTAALAGPQCTDQPRDKWLLESEMKAKILAAGHKIEVFKVTAGNCYEIYGRNKDGRRVEIYYDPLTGEPVKQSVR